MSNKRYHIHINVKTDDDLRKELIKVTELLVRLRVTTNDWEQHYGYVLKTKKKEAEAAADKYINSKKVIIEE